MSLPSFSFILAWMSISLRMPKPSLAMSSRARATVAAKVWRVVLRKAYCMRAGRCTHPMTVPPSDPGPCRMGATGSGAGWRRPFALGLRRLRLRGLGLDDDGAPRPAPRQQDERDAEDEERV